MRKLILFILFGVICFKLLSAQSFNDTTEIWSTGLLSWEGVPTMSYYVKLGEDTIIEQNKYFKVLKSTDKLHERWLHIGYLRTENEKVYFRHDIEVNEILFYDFSLEKGQSFYISELNTNLTVDSVSKMQIANVEKKVLYLSASDLHGQVIWCEDIGSLNGILNRYGNIGITGGYEDLLCVQIQGKLIYKNTLYNKCFFTNTVNSLYENSIQKEINIYPNPSTGRFFLSAKNFPVNNGIIVNIYDLLGNKMDRFDFRDKTELDLTHYKKGVYIIIFRTVKGLYMEKIVLIKL